MLKDMVKDWVSLYVEIVLLISGLKTQEIVIL